jgi:hypothetical protein
MPISEDALLAIDAEISRLKRLRNRLLAEGGIVPARKGKSASASNEECPGRRMDVDRLDSSRAED